MSRNFDNFIKSLSNVNPSYKYEITSSNKWMYKVISMKLHQQVTFVPK